MGMTIEEIIENLTTIRTKLCSRKYETESTLTFDSAIENLRKYEYDHNKIEKIAAILKTAKADPTRDEYAEYYLDAIEEVIRWTQI